MARGQVNEYKVTVEKEFNFTFPTITTNEEYALRLPIRIPLDETVKEFSHRIMQAFKLPCYVLDDLQEAVNKFVHEETIKYYDDLAERDIEESKSQSFDIDEVVRSWEKLFRNETVEYTEPIGTTDEELFSTVYHKLVHSPALEVILQEEQAYASTAGAAASKRTHTITKLAERQNDEMAAAVKGLHSKQNEKDLKITEKDINELAVKHFEEHSLAAGRLNSEVEALHESQRKEYRMWLMTVLEQQAVCPSPLSSPVSARVPENTIFSQAVQDHEPWPELEESFTIHLGSQMKQMHNVRILSGDVLNFCKIRTQPEGSIEIDPQRVETALALYSSGLSGMVLLSDVGPVDGFSGFTQDFADVCHQTTEFHFPTIDDQLQNVKSQIKEAVTWRAQKAKSGEQQQIKRSGTSKNLQSGDMYITKHSNLSQVHVVFHMLIDDSVKSNDMNSRHPVILGLRNVLKTAASYDVTTLTIPLLLTHEMTEDMTVAWCSKRAELVFKCVKGFMIEAAGAGGAELHNLQFLVPTGISPEVFSTLATMLPSIFRVSNPLVLKASSK